MKCFRGGTSSFGYGGTSPRGRATATWVPERHVHGAVARATSQCGRVALRAGGNVAVMLVARFDGDVNELSAAYDRAHALIMSRGGAVPSGERRHHCALGDSSLYMIGVWESELHVRRRWA